MKMAETSEERSSVSEIGGQLSASIAPPLSALLLS